FVFWFWSTKVYNAGELAFIFLLKKPITTRLWRDYQLSSFSSLAFKAAEIPASLPPIINNFSVSFAI
ncbi:hypothetical protein ACJ30F_09910, partial [Limosilactobacillus fermentum]|uniref:hypothetical protein n=1 Tax=Limosilactobacillus fermentum TaxID=1613 RepID=UPI00389A4403